jgi:hypothetical protein
MQHQLEYIQEKKEIKESPFCFTVPINPSIHRTRPKRISIKLFKYIPIPPLIETLKQTKITPNYNHGFQNNQQMAKIIRNG